MKPKWEFDKDFKVYECSICKKEDNSGFTCCFSDGERWIVPNKQKYSSDEGIILAVAPLQDTHVFPCKSKGI